MAAPMVAACVVSRISRTAMKSKCGSILPGDVWCSVSKCMQHRSMSTLRTSIEQASSYMDTRNESSQEIMLELPPEEDDGDKGVGLTEVEQRRKLNLKPDPPPDAKVLKVALIGAPNAGKSTLTNRLIKWKIAAVSTKVHTTRENATTILTEGNTQIIFRDTPGTVNPINKKKHRLQRSLILGPEKSLHDVDLVGVVVDAADKWTRNELNKKLLKILHLHQHLPSVLILNKTDAVKTKEVLLEIASNLTDRKVDGEEIEVMSYSRLSALKKLKNDMSLKEKVIEKYDKLKQDINSDWSQDHRGQEESEDNDDRINVNTQEREWQNYVRAMNRLERVVQDQRSWPKFDRVFMVSGLENDGVEELRDFFFSKAQPGQWEYHSSLVSDQNPFDLAKMIVWEKLLDHLPKRIPYNLWPEIYHWDFDEQDRLTIIMTIKSPNEWHTKHLFGPKGTILRNIAYEASQEIMNMLRYDVRLNITVKTKSKYKWT